MKRPSVYVTRPFPEEALRSLQERCDVEVCPDPQPLPKKELLLKLKDRVAILVSGTKIDEEIIRSIKSHCRILANSGVGYENIDVEAATRHGVFVSNNPGIVTDDTADLAFMLMLATARRVVECDRFVRSGQKKWGPTNLLGTRVSGKTLGIIGGGRIGAAVGQRARGFNMNVIYCDLRPNPNFEQASGGTFLSRESVLKESDFVSLHVPLLPSTRHFISQNEFRLMKKTAILVNTSRGPVIDENALLNALREGEIAGAGLDVFEKEPEITPGLTELPNVILTPHIGTATTETRIRMGQACARNIFAVLDGKTPPTCVNPEAANADRPCHENPK